MTKSTVDKIIDIAESQVRAGGYNSFSFREISKEIGIKSASIHYHFPTKTDLGVTLASRYTERFAEKLLQIQTHSSDSQERFSQYIALFRYALDVEKKMCLCGQLASESDVLPDAIRLEAKRFFEINIVWLEANVFNGKDSGFAVVLLSCLEGALMMSKVMGSNKPLDDVSNKLTTLLFV
jgi:TetR/AcrR family transcriptional regulator, transcriptional repressor for nem operon